MSDTQRTLLLVDGSSYLYRAFHAMPDLRVNPGDPTSQAVGAIRGMINMINSLRKEVPARYAACVFDAKGPTFRDQLYPEYKAHRSPMPDDLRSQIEPIHEVVRLLGWRVLDVPGVEADDVIGTLAHLAAQQGIEVIISSGDKDLSQLVNAHITMVDTMNGKRRDIAGVTAEFGVPPELMLDFQTLVGDAVDNVPGVPKVGPKTAAKWLQEYGSLNNLIAHAADIKGVAGENLRQSLGWLPTAKNLLHIRTDCDLAGHVNGLPDLGELTLSEPDSEALADFYGRHGFKTLVAQSGGSTRASPRFTSTPAQNSSDTASLFDDPPPAAQTISEVSYETVLDLDHLDRWVQQISAAELTCIDTETTSLDGMQARLVGISLATQSGQAAYIPLTHNGPACPTQLDIDTVLARLKPWLENPACPKLGQHIKYDRHVLANHGIEVRGYRHDTMLQSYVLEVHKPHSLESLALRHLGLQGLSYEQLCGKGVHQIPFAQVELTQAARYACEDADFTLRVHQLLWPRLQAVPELWAVYQLEIDSSESLYRMERNGVLIDAQVLAQQSHELGQRILDLERQAHDLAGQPFNLGSPKQIGEIFFQRLGLPVVKKTATGAPSTDEEVLEKLAEDYPLPKVILEHRGLSKLKGTYTDKLAAMAHPSDGRVHTHYAQAVAVTGRLSSNDPNLQNIPIRTPEGRRVREAFVASPGCLIASADYSQIELRIMAHISQDPALLRAFHEGLDVHRATAAEVFGIAPDQVSADQRRYAKVINFGLIYGMSAFGLARALDIDHTAARNYIERYFQRFEGVRRYMDETRAQAKAQGYVQTVLGRRLYLPEINSPNGPRRAAAERAAINAPMQGTAADLIKMSMNQVQKTLDEQKRRTRMIMQVHDELVFEVPQDEVDWLRQTIPTLMAGVAQLRVPLLAELGLGPNWDQAH
jgi:DNA polymerase I